MKFSEAVRHLESLGLVVAEPVQKRPSKRFRLRNPRTVVPVEIIKNGTGAKGLVAAIRQSRAETRNSSRTR